MTEKAKGCITLSFQECKHGCGEPDHAHCKENKESMRGIDVDLDVTGLNGSLELAIARYFSAIIYTITKPALAEALLTIKRNPILQEESPTSEHSEMLNELFHEIVLVQLNLAKKNAEVKDKHEKGSMNDPYH